MAWFVYLLRCGDGSLYTGYTDDVERRVAVHQSGKGGKYTRSHLPVTLVYQEELASRSDAMRREAAIKRLSRREKLALIQSSEAAASNLPALKRMDMRRKDREMTEEFT